MFSGLSPMSVIVVGLALVAMMGTVGILLINRLQDKRTSAAEKAVAKASHEYFARFRIRARTMAAQLADGSMVLMVETPPHKKLRFSYIIEPPIKNFIHVQTGIEVARIFWRFPIPARKTDAPDVKYVDPDAAMLDPASGEPGNAEPSRKTEADATHQVDTESDDYFQQHQTYHIEEVSWENFSTVTQGSNAASKVSTSRPANKK